MARNRELRYLTKEEIIKIIGSIQNNRDKLIFQIFYETGCTLKELTFLKKKNFDLILTIYR